MENHKYRNTSEIAFHDSVKNPIITPTLFMVIEQEHASYYRKDSRQMISPFNEPVQVCQGHRVGMYAAGKYQIFSHTFPIFLERLKQLTQLLQMRALFIGDLHQSVFICLGFCPVS